MPDSLTALLPAGAVSTDPEDLRAHATDWWALALLRARRGDDVTLPAAVVRPSSTEEVAVVLRWAQETRTPVVPFGGGSGVCGAAQAVDGAIALDVRRLDAVLEVDERSLLVRAQAGILGSALEDALMARGLTLGHYPQSIDISTLGGWLSSRGAGQKSSRYGRIEDMVLGLEVVLPGGRIVRTPAPPATAAGPDLARLFVGAEGTLGVITEATLALHPAPTTVGHAAYEFASFEMGLDALRTVAQARMRPAVARLYDPADATVAFRTFEERFDGAPMVLRFEGGEGEQLAVCAAIEHAGGVHRGEAPASYWWEHRNNAVRAYREIMAGEMLGPTTVVDTMEIAATWTDVARAYASVRDALARHTDHVGCHASHVYPQGACLYFTFLMLGSPDDDAAEQRYRAAWSAGMEAALAAGATVSHHHGVGLLKAPWAARELGASLDVLRDVKRALDPAGIMNPGKLGL